MKTRLNLSIATIDVALTIDDPALAARSEGRYADFLRQASARSPLEIRVAAAPGPPPDDLHPEWVANPAVDAVGTLDRVELRGLGFAGFLDWSARRGECVVPAAQAHVDLFVRVALGVELLRRGGTLLHAAAVVRDDFGVAFSGPSGAGKSTVAEISRAAGLTVLSDEMIAFVPAGVGRRFHGTPFWRGAPLAAPCGALVFLEQAPRHRARRLSPAEALPRLMAAGGAPLPLPDVQSAFFEAAGAVLRRVPAYALEFLPDAGLWDALDAFPEFSFFRPAPPQAPALAPPAGPARP